MTDPKQTPRSGRIDHDSRGETPRPDLSRVAPSSG